MHEWYQVRKGGDYMQMTEKEWNCHLLALIDLLDDILSKTAADERMIAAREEK